MKLTNEKALKVVLEYSCEPGVCEIAHTFANDIELVLGKLPELKFEDGKAAEQAVFVVTAGKSEIYDRAVKAGVIPEISGKREVFSIRVLKDFEGAKEALLIAGSDKRGTIYGMFTVSEALGVSPWVFWGDVEPQKKAEIELTESLNQDSKEPSVLYRGFFINDEWPCYGTWVNHTYGGFNATGYRMVFELLLRLKGNYLWPAMWTSSFPLDGPGDQDMKLADLLGVVMGTSHHEPCLRASEEWDLVRGPESRYGNAWNYYTNEEGLKNYWADSLEARGKYESVITIGMRGERDSSMLGPDATLRENIELLKRILHEQNALIKKYVNPDLTKVPRMIALYKEVEPYFYGDKDTPGLKDSPELDNVICMFSEDNFGHLRSVPSEEIRKRNGGFGMYYHLDYHGDPISWEWIDAMKPTQMKDQMSEAYEYGIRDLWIVNVGDVKFHEVSLGYFLKLAYDYEGYGNPNPNGVERFLQDFAGSIAPGDEALEKRIAWAFNEYQHLMFLRRPEALHTGVYDPAHELESDRMLERADALLKESEAILAALPDHEKDGYYSTLHFQVKSGVNLLKMFLYAGKNEHYARQGRKHANVYADLTEECIAKDTALLEEWRNFKNGKWFGMELAPHVGFTKWNEAGKHYPIVMRVTPLAAPAMGVSRADGDKVCYQNYAVHDFLELYDFTEPGCDRVTIEIANEGTGGFKYEITSANGEWPEYITVSAKEGTVEDLVRVDVICDRSKMKADFEEAVLTVSDGVSPMDLKIRAKKAPQLPKGTFIMNGHAVTIPATAFVRTKDTADGGFKVLPDYGKYEGAVEVLPVLSDFAEAKGEKPEAVYSFYVEEAGTYVVRLLCSPTNPVEYGRPKRIEVKAGGTVQKIEILPSTFKVGTPRDKVWCKGVLEQIHTAEAEFELPGGLQEISLLPVDPCVPVERIAIYKKGTAPAESYFGPEPRML